MKKNILKTAAILLILSGMISCGEEEKEKNQSLDLGIYVETYPTQGRTRINLIDGKKLAIIREQENQNDYVVFYEIIEKENTVKFFNIEDRLENGGGYFKIINRTKFEISNLYYAPAYGTSIIMTFEKENVLNDEK
jgi:hypothetical protein